MIQYTIYTIRGGDKLKCAVLSDIHGNIRAFEAVLADAKASGADSVIFLGDLVFMGLDPQLCFDLLMEQKPLVTIKGNTDGNLEMIKLKTANALYDEPMVKLVKYADIRMNTQAKKKLADFLPTKHIDIEGLSLLCCHGTPYSDTEGLCQNQPFSPSLAKQLAAENVDIVLSAHTHIPADFQRDGIRYINPGAVGYSLDGDVRASYALLSISEGVATCKIRRVEYDIKRYLKEVEHASEGFKLLDRLVYALTYGRPKT